VSKKKAVQAPNINVLERVTLYERDIERIEKWRKDIRWLELSWLGRLVRWPLRHPKITASTAFITTTAVAAVIAHDRGRETSELRVNVRF